jgi:hypothetical protein
VRLRTTALARLVALALVPAPAGAAAAGGGTTAGRATHPFHGNGMWIWYVSASAHGKYSRIARKAHRHHIRTIYVKSSDGSSAWQQFTPNLISFMHRRGIRVCAWQYVYGTYPAQEASRGAEAIHKGADCLVIDAESEYERYSLHHRYGHADRYIDRLRSHIGRRFPVALAGFPYVDYHPGFPYSVFLGRKGAQYNLPQLYWYTIGTTVPQGYAHTFTYNRVYERPIMPLGQTYGGPPPDQIRLFRRYAHSYEFRGVSWWSWQETSGHEWPAVGRKVGRVPGVHRPLSSFPYLHAGSQGDLVVWAQEHLRGAGRHPPVTGYFGDKTVRAVRHFQADEGLHVNGAISTATWRHLLRHRAVWINWSGKPGSAKSGDIAEPRSADLPPVRDEIPPPSERLTGG